MTEPNLGGIAELMRTSDDTFAREVARLIHSIGDELDGPDELVEYCFRVCIAWLLKENHALAEIAAEVN